MCEQCDGPDQSIEVTEDNAPFMLQETTTVALQAAFASSNGWFRAAKGFTVDMMLKWGMHAATRLAYVWGSAAYFLQRPADAPEMNAGYTRMTEISRKVTGEEPDAAHMAHLVAVNDQAVTVLKAIAEAASKGDMEQVAKLIDDVPDAETTQCVMAMLLAEAGLRIRYTSHVEDELSMDLFMAHVNAGMDDEEGEEAGGTS